MVFSFHTTRGNISHDLHSNEGNGNKMSGIYVTSRNIKVFPYEKILKVNKRYKKLTIGRNAKIDIIDESKMNQLKHLEVIEINTDVTKIENFTIPKSDSLKKLRINLVDKDKYGFEEKVSTALKSNKNTESHNKINSFLEKLPIKCNKLEELQIKGYPIIELPSAIYNLQHLKILKIVNCGLTKLSDHISNLNNLKELDVSKNHISKLPRPIVKLEKLEKLDLRSMELNSLPPRMDKMQKLQTMHLVTPREGFPPSILKLINRPNNIKTNIKLYINASANTNYNKRRLNKNSKNIGKPLNITNRTDIINASLMANNSRNNIPSNRLAFIDIPGEKYNNGTLRRIYDHNGLLKYTNNKPKNKEFRLYGDKFKRSDIKLLNNYNYSINK